jgi:hypothetical protein
VTSREEEDSEVPAPPKNKRPDIRTKKQPLMTFRVIDFHLLSITRGI